MKRHLFAVVGVFALACACAAQEPKPAPAAPKGETAKRAIEEVEALEAHLHTKKAFIQAAVVAVRAAEFTLDRAAKAGAGPTALDEAKLGIEAAKAHLLIREAELNEVAVKVKHARRRAEEAQKAEADVNLPAPRADVEAALQAAKAEFELATRELKRLEELATRGIVAESDMAAAREKRKAAELQVHGISKILQRMPTIADFSRP